MNKKSPLVSVVMPIFNAQNYISKALESILHQTYQNLEIIVINDGSTDSSREILESFNDPRIKLISRENRGLIATLNEGIALSSGMYIARMDADDICYPARIERQVEYLESHKDIGVLFTGLEYIDAKGSVIKTNVTSKFREVFPVQLLFGCPVCHPTAIFNLRLLAKEDIKYDSDFKNTEDFELWTRLISRTKVGILAGELFQYRIHTQSITSTNNLNQRNIAVKAISENLLHVKSTRIKKSIGIIYNNRQGNDSNFQTFFAIFFVFLNLKRINKSFTYYHYMIRSYRLMRKLIFNRDANSLR
tara:strand:- start:3936 stop:4847 length:912 start_codon:yes stop_codon:yes gene_type:complete